MSIKIIDNFFCDVADRAHCDDDAVGIGCAVIVKEFIVGAYSCVDFVHIVLDYLGQCIVICVACLSVLEEYVAVLCRAAQYGMLGVESAFAECVDSVFVNHLAEGVIVPYFDLRDFVRSAETVKEIDKGNSALDGRKVCDRAEVHDLLRVGTCHHSITGLAACHNVGMIAENVKSVRSDASCRNVNNAGQKFACDLVHVGDHQQQTLRCGKCGGESAGCK